MPRLPFLLATWFGCGLAPRAPGTAGTLGALPVGTAILYAGGWPVLLAATAILFLIGLWAAAAYERHTGTHDSGAIVIDEAAGLWLALCAAGTHPAMLLAAFILFRGFDILKPWPVSWADRRLPGAWGVMVDDILAGAYAALCLAGMHMGMNIVFTG